MEIICDVWSILIIIVIISIIIKGVIVIIPNHFTGVVFFFN